MDVSTLFRVLVENLPDAVYFKDVDSRFVLVNKAKAEHMGLADPEEVAGKTDFDFYNEEFARQAYMDEQRIIKTGKPIRKVEKVVYKDGRARWVSVIKIPIKNKEGEVVGIAGISTDITELKRMEEELRDSGEIFRIMFESARDGLVVIDFSGRIAYWNPAAEKIFGYSKEYVKGRKIYDLIIPAESREGKRRRLERFFKIIEDTGETKEITGQRKDGKGIPLEISYSKFSFKGKQYGLAVIRDITERKMLLERLREERDKARRYLDVAEVIIVALDRDGRVSLINRKGREILGCESEEIIGKDWIETFIPERIRGKVREVTNSLLSGEAEKFRRFENPVLTRSGEERVIAWYNTILKDNEGNVIGILSSGMDVTEKKQYEMKLRDLAYRLNGLRPGGIFVCKSHERCFKAFADLTFYGIPGICLLREDPERIIERYAINPKSIMIVASKPLKGYPALDDLQKISLTISKFMQENSMCVILLDGLEYLINLSGFKPVFRFIEEKHLDFIENRGLLLIPFDLETLLPQERALLLSEVEELK